MEKTRIVRYAREEDLDAVLELYGHLHPGDAPKPGRAELERVWTEIRTSPHFHCLVAEEQYGIVATCTMAVVPNLTRGAKPFAVLENVVTHPDHRGRGHGSAVVRAALDAAWRQRCYKVMLLTDVSRADVADFYVALGFSKDKKNGLIITDEQAA